MKQSPKLKSGIYILLNLEERIKKLEDENYELITYHDLDEDIEDECWGLESIPRYAETDPKKTGFEEEENPFQAIKKDGNIIACLYAFVLDENINPEDNIIHFSIAVNVEHRKKGIAKWLINNILDYAKDKKIKIVMADVINRNLERYLYSIGFKYSECDYCIGKRMSIDLDPSEEWEGYDL